MAYTYVWTLSSVVTDREEIYWAIQQQIDDGNI